MIKAIQIIEFYGGFASAQQGLEFQRTQEGYLGGRLLGPDSQHQGWRMQAFYDAEGVEDGVLLPDGMRLVVIPDSLRSTLLCYKPEEPKEEEDLSARSYFGRVQKKLGCYTCRFADPHKLGESGCCTARGGPSPDEHGENCSKRRAIP